MTTPPRQPRNPRAALLRTIAVAAAVALLGGAGCEKKAPPKPPPPPPPPPPAPKAPDPVTVDGILQSMNADPRVQFPQAKAPTDESFARAVIALADSIVRGDAAKLRPMLMPPARAVLEQLEGGEDWSNETSKLEAARVVLASSPMAVIALQDPDGAYILGWVGTKVGDSWVFNTAPTSGEIRRRASEWDAASPLDLMDSSMMGMAGSLPDLPDLPSDLGDIPADPTAVPAQPDEPEDPNAPIRKSTPGGPVNIPRPPGSG